MVDAQPTTGGDALLSAATMATTGTSSVERRSFRPSTIEVDPLVLELGAAGHETFCR